METPITEIAGYPYPNRISSFRLLCKNYKTNQYWIKSMQENMLEKDQERVFQASNGKLFDQEEVKERYALFQQNVNAVEKTLEKIRMFYGREAEEMVKEAYVYGKSRKEIAEKYNLSEAALQRKYHTWLASIFYEKERDAA